MNSYSTEIAPQCPAGDKLQHEGCHEEEHGLDLATPLPVAWRLTSKTIISLLGGCRKKLRGQKNMPKCSPVLRITQLNQKREEPEQLSKKKRPSFPNRI